MCRHEDLLNRVYTEARFELLLPLRSFIVFAALVDHGRHVDAPDRM